MSAAYLANDGNNLPPSLSLACANSSAPPPVPPVQSERGQASPRKSSSLARGALCNPWLKGRKTASTCLFSGERLASETTWLHAPCARRRGRGREREGERGRESGREGGREARVENNTRDLGAKELLVHNNTMSAGDGRSYGNPLSCLSPREV